VTPDGAIEGSKPEERLQAATDREALSAQLKLDPEPIDPRAKEAALRRLRDAPEEELAVFADALRGDAAKAGASEQELRTAQTDHPEH
jgi:hypothetical protein